MPTKTSIIDNVEMYSAQELHRFICDGIIEFDELVRETAGYLPADVRKELSELIKEGAAPKTQTPPPSAASGYNPDNRFWEEETAEPDTGSGDADDPWTSVDKSDIESLKWFISTYPDHPMRKEANRLINELFTATHVSHDVMTLKREVNDIMTNRSVLNKDAKIVSTIQEYLEKRYITPSEFIKLLAEDHNFISSYVVKQLIEAGDLTYADLGSAGIDQRFISYLIQKGPDSVRFLQPTPITQVNKVSTEIYFWGIPSSGKTCALGGIMSMAKNGHTVVNMSPDNDCQGYGYMTRLADVFRENESVGNLPPGTAIYDIWEMGFDLEDPDGKVHPITCIDLAGELVRCMYKTDAGEMLTDDEVATLQTVTNLLVSNRSTNRKMHFFVLEYGGEERVYEGLDQSTYLQAALSYIKRTKIFQKDTDGVFLLFTKVDKTGLTGQELVDHLVHYTDRYYSNFYNGLVAICRDNEINGGKVERLPFTLGNVCFQNYCLFNGQAAENVVRLLLNRTKGFKKGKLQNILNKAKG